MDGIDTDRLETLLAWKRKLDEELQELRARQNELNETIAHKETQVRNLRELLESEGHVVAGDPGREQAPNGSVADAAWRLIKDIGQPVYYKDLAERLRESGVTIPGRDPQANLLSYIARDQRFKRIARGTYALTEWRLRPKGKKRASQKRKTGRGRGHARGRRTS